MEFAIKNRENGLFESIEFSNKQVVQTIGKTLIDLMAKLNDNEFSKYSTIRNGNIVTKIDMPSEVIMKLSSRLPFSYTISNEEEHVYYNKHKIKDFLYEIDYGNIDYDYAKEFFETQTVDESYGFCSAVHNGNFYGRNLDWLYDNNVDFVVRTPKSDKRYGVLGVAGSIPNMVSNAPDNDIVELNGYNMFKLVPFYLLDGINENGVFINTNVEPLKEILGEGNIISNALIEEKEKLSSKMIPRFVLDNFNDVLSAIKYIRDYVTVYIPTSLIKSNYQVHYLIGDRRNTYAMEFENGKVVYRKINQLTNFHVNNINFNPDGKVYTPQDVELNEENKPTVKNNMELYGAGLERWNLIIDNYRKANTKDGMRNLMDNLYYSRTYLSSGNVPDKIWYSETTHEKNDLWYEEGEPSDDDPKYIINVDTKPSDMDKIEELMSLGYSKKERGVIPVWITVHSCVYDISKKTLYLKTQEENEEMIFKI